MREAALEPQAPVKLKTGFAPTPLRWVHARRGLEEVFVSNGSLIAKAGLERIAQFYGIEEQIRDEPLATRKAVRWTESAPLVNAFGVWLDKQRSPRSRHRSRTHAGHGGLRAVRISRGCAS